MNSWLRRIVFIVAILSVTGVLTFAQQDKSRNSLSCRDNWYSDRLMGHCEVKEQTIPAGGAITIDARKNGGVSVKGWDRNEILVRARIHAAASTQSEADELAKQIRIETAGGKIFAEGPSS